MLARGRGVVRTGVVAVARVHRHADRADLEHRRPCAGADACLATDQGDTICVPPGTPACAAGTPDRCEADTLVYCIGNPTDGYVELRGACPGCTIDATGNASCT